MFRGGRREEHLRICAFAHLHHHLDVVDKKKEPERQDDATTPPPEPSPAPCCQQLILPSLSSNGVHAHAREGEGTCCAHAAAASPSPTYTLKSEIEASLGHKGTQRDNLEPVCRVRCPFVLLTVPTSHAAALQIAKINRRLRESR